MEIINKGKLIEQYKRNTVKLNEYFKEYECIKEVFEIINKKNKNEEDYKKINTKLESNFDNHKEIKDFLFFYKSLRHSYNKNRGTVLEYIFKCLFENTERFEVIESKELKKMYLEPNNKYIDYMTLCEDLQINNKRINIYSILEDREISSITIGCSELNITNFINNDYLNFKKIEIKKVLKNSNMVSLKIFFENNTYLFDLIEYMKSTGIFYKKELSKLIPDMIVKVKGTKKIYIIECKDREHTKLEIDDLSKGIAYAQKYKAMSNSKIKESLVLLKGDESEELIDKKDAIENLYKNSTKSNIIIHKAEDFIDEINQEYNKNRFNKILIQREEIVKGKNKGKIKNINNYSYFYDSNLSSDVLEVDFDFEFMESNISKDYEEKEVKDQDEEERYTQSWRKELSKRGIELEN